MNDDTWPPAPRPNPLLPAIVQREAGSARSSAEVEYQFALRVQSRLLFAAPDITFSYALADGNRIRRPSPLLEGIAQCSSHFDYPQTLAAQLANAHAGACEAIDDTAAHLLRPARLSAAEAPCYARRRFAPHGPSINIGLALKPSRCLSRDSTRQIGAPWFTPPSKPSGLEDGM